MALIEIHRNPSQRELKWFGLMLMVFCALVGGLAIWRFDAWSFAKTVWAVGALATVVYYAVPPIRKPLFVGWMMAVYPIGLTISFIIMWLTYYAVLTPIGLLLRLFHVQVFDAKLDRQTNSYWRPHPAVSGKHRYFQQF